MWLQCLKLVSQSSEQNVHAERKNDQGDEEKDDESIGDGQFEQEARQDDQRRFNAALGEDCL